MSRCVGVFAHGENLHVGTKKIRHGLTREVDRSVGVLARVESLHAKFQQSSPPQRNTVVGVLSIALGAHSPGAHMQCVENVHAMILSWDSNLRTSRQFARGCFRHVENLHGRSP